MLERRSIPAGAGETGYTLVFMADGEVDPRGCGGDKYDIQVKIGPAGRSPRVRGRPTIANKCEYFPGSIPAGAGETPAQGWPHVG